jgi:hypothetical protein
MNKDKNTHKTENYGVYFYFDLEAKVKDYGPSRLHLGEKDPEDTFLIRSPIVLYLGCLSGR